MSEKADLQKTLIEKVEATKDEEKLRKIMEILRDTNNKLNHHDSAFENFLSNVVGLLTPKQKKKAVLFIKDIFDKYDKKEKGIDIYSPAEKQMIADAIKQINDICDEDFWDRFWKVLGVGS